MPIKVSNQITFVEHKKIVKIEEWYLATDKSDGVKTTDNGWTTTMPSINATNKYLWNYEKVSYSLGDPDVSEPVIISTYVNSIADITNYYAVTSDTNTPASTSWGTTVSSLSPTNKYLWNYEVITYTNGDQKTTEPAIIGAYGDSGSDVNAIDFQIYSTDGFEFSDDLTSITLKTIAFQGGQQIQGNISYQWQWWNVESNAYTNISGKTSSTLIVNDTDEYAYASLKCRMTYDGVTYVDYVSLTKATDVYTASVKFWNGNNIIAVGDEHIIAYVELYKNNIVEEMLYSNSIYTAGLASVSGEIITINMSGTYKDGDKMYFIYQPGVAQYDTVLGQYSSDGKWKVQKSNYTYKNNIFVNATSPVIYIPRSQISRVLTINCEIQKNNDNKDTIARTSAMVMDLNDPIVSTSNPSNPQKGQLWLDTSVSPSILKMYDGSDWVNSGYQDGNTVYTSRPSTYVRGDLWILATGEICGDFTAGSMLRANTTVTSADNFSISHWQDAMGESTQILNNVKQYFEFNADKGLKIGQSDERFYVNISSTEMGFYGVDNNDVAKKVVNIGTTSATIKDLTVQEGLTVADNATFQSEVKFGKFLWQSESNNSLSLVLVT